MNSFKLISRKKKSIFIFSSSLELQLGSHQITNPCTICLNMSDDITYHPYGYCSVVYTYKNLYKFCL